MIRCCCCSYFHLLCYFYRNAMGVMHLHTHTNRQIDKFSTFRHLLVSSVLRNPVRSSPCIHSLFIPLLVVSCCMENLQLPNTLLYQSRVELKHCGKIMFFHPYCCCCCCCRKCSNSIFTSCTNWTIG